MALVHVKTKQVLRAALAKLRQQIELASGAVHFVLIVFPRISLHFNSPIVIARNDLRLELSMSTLLETALTRGIFAEARIIH